MVAAYGDSVGPTSAMAKQNRELELKLTGSASLLGTLPGSPFLSALIRGNGQWSRLASTYYDTPTGALKAAGISLRRREEGGKLIQTVKSISNKGVMSRREWETAVSAGDPRPAVTGKGAIDVLLDQAAQSLRPVSEIVVDRWQAEFQYQTSLIEVSIDQGRASAQSPLGAMVSGPIAEIELELLEGNLADLFVAARMFLDRGGLRLHLTPKQEQATLIANGRAYSVPGRQSFIASTSDTAGDVLRAALIKCAERIIELQPSIVEGRAPEGIHQMRVELRRFRAVERAFRNATRCPNLMRLAERAKSIGRALGQARDWDVFLDETVAGIPQQNGAVAGFARLKSEANAARAEAWSVAARQIGEREFAVFSLDLLSAAHLGRWQSEALKRPVRGYAKRALDRSLKKTRKIARQVNPNDLATLHPMRIALKKLRYAVQLFRGAYPKEERRSYMAAMASLQDLLGAVNDAVVAQKLADGAAEGLGKEAMRAAGFVCGFYAARGDDAAAKIDAAWALFEKTRPFWRD